MKKIYIFISIKTFEFIESDGMTNNDYSKYTVECNDRCNVTIKKKREKDVIEYEISKESIKELENIIIKYNVYKWNGFNKDKNVPDSSSFTLNIKLENNKNIKAHGGMEYPNNYRLVKEEINSYFNNLIK